MNKDAQGAATGGRGRLVVLFHGFRQHRGRLGPVEAQIRKAWPDATIHSPNLPIGLKSFAHPDAIVAAQLEQIDAMWQAHQFAEIILIGHSAGGLLARKLYVVACGESRAAPFGPQFKGGGKGLLPARPWAGSVTRIVMVAAINRGWRISHHVNPLRALGWSAGAAVAELFSGFTGKKSAMLHFRWGASFVTQLRIQWLLMRRRADAGSGRPGGALAVQLLGSRDDVVGPNDNVDLVAGGDFKYLDVPYSGHLDVTDMDDPMRGAERARIFQLALRGSVEQLDREAVLPADDAAPMPDPSVRRVVFVMHGIRDAGHWTHKVARRVKQQAGPGVATWATETSSYGYFPMLPFLFPWPRRAKVEWFMEQYTEALARYPRARFSYLGHSNGTYLLARALELYPCCRFRRVVFAGSVVHREFDWPRFLDARPPRVQSVLNLVATRDWVVAFFPKLFQWLRSKDLGSAGHDGFRVPGGHPRLHQVVGIKGGHDAAVAEPLWDVITHFILTGQVDRDRLLPLQGPPSRWLHLAGKFPPLAWIVIAALLFLLARFIAATLWCSIADPGVAGFAVGVALTLYVGLVWLVVTRL